MLDSTDTLKEEAMATIERLNRCLSIFGTRRGGEPDHVRPCPLNCGCSGGSACLDRWREEMYSAIGDQGAGGPLWRAHVMEVEALFRRQRTEAIHPTKEHCEWLPSLLGRKRKDEWEALVEEQEGELTFTYERQSKELELLALEQERELAGLEEGDRCGLFAWHKRERELLARDQVRGWNLLFDALLVRRERCIASLRAGDERARDAAVRRNALLKEQEEGRELLRKRQRTERSELGRGSKDPNGGTGNQLGVPNSAAEEYGRRLADTVRGIEACLGKVQRAERIVKEAEKGTERRVKEFIERDCGCCGSCGRESRLRYLTEATTPEAD